MKVSLDRITYVVPPSPVILLSTMEKKGRENIAPFGFFMLCSKNPPVVAIGLRKETESYKNIKETGEFVTAIPTPKIAEQVYKAGNLYEEDEFGFLGLTPVKSDNIKPKRIKECQTNLECKFIKETELSGSHTVIFGKVVTIDINEKVFSEENSEMRNNLDSLYHVTKNNFKKWNGEKIKV